MRGPPAQSSLEAGCSRASGKLLGLHIPACEPENFQLLSCHSRWHEALADAAPRQGPACDGCRGRSPRGTSSLHRQVYPVFIGWDFCSGLRQVLHTLQPVHFSLAGCRKSFLLLSHCLWLRKCLKIPGFCHLLPLPLWVTGGWRRSKQRRPYAREGWRVEEQRLLLSSCCSPGDLASPLSAAAPGVLKASLAWLSHPSKGWGW